MRADNDLTRTSARPAADGWSPGARCRRPSLRSRDLAITIVALPLVPVAALSELIAGLSHRGGTIAVLARRTEYPRGARDRGPASAGEYH